MKKNQCHYLYRTKENLYRCDREIVAPNLKNIIDYTCSSKERTQYIINQYCLNVKQRTRFIVLICNYGLDYLRD